MQNLPVGDTGYSASFGEKGERAKPPTPNDSFHSAEREAGGVTRLSPLSSRSSLKPEQSALGLVHFQKLSASPMMRRLLWSSVSESWETRILRGLTFLTTPQSKACEGDSEA